MTYLPRYYLCEACECWSCILLQFSTAYIATSLCLTLCFTFIANMNTSSMLPFSFICSQDEVSPQSGHRILPKGIKKIPFWSRRRKHPQCLISLFDPGTASEDSRISWWSWLSCQWGASHSSRYWLTWTSLYIIQSHQLHFRGRSMAFQGCDALVRNRSRP